MILESCAESYRAFRRSLEQFQSVYRQTDGRGSLIQSKFQALQQQFQAILALNLDSLNSALVANLQAYYTEINKQLRLLSMDVIFLQASRQGGTMQQRQQQMDERIRLLLKYCQALLAEVEGKAAE
jgi:hypothetical protein